MGAKFDKLLPELTDLDIMESVTPDDVLVVPTVEDNKPRNQRKRVPNMSLILKDESIETRVIYRDRESLELLRNLFREAHRAQREALFNYLKSLDPSYETLLYSTARDESKPRLVRKYVTARLDQQLIERLIDESEGLLRGGRRAQNNSAYTHPEKPELVLARKVTPLDQGEYLTTLDALQPIYRTLTRVMTNREIISSRLSTPRRRKNQYREFIELLNEARGGDYISAEKRRALNDRWRNDEESRDELIEELRELLDK